MATRFRLEQALMSWILGRGPRQLRWFTGSPATNDRGDRLDPQLQALIRLEGLAGAAPLGQRTIAQSRADLIRGVRLVEAPPVPLAHVWEQRFGGVRCRVYVPMRRGPDAPVLAYAHGGGWVLGDLRSHDRVCRRLAHDLGWTVVAIDYRLAPEHPFPTPVRDVCAAFRAIRDSADLFSGRPERVALGGDSAGANLAAATTLMLRDAGEPQPPLQVLIYPGVDMHRRSRSHQTLGSGFLLTTTSIDFYLAHYAADPDDPLASPIDADLTGLAPAIVLTCGFDPLRDEGEAYGAQLSAAGVPATMLYEPSLTHGFIHMDGAIEAADRALLGLTAAMGTATS